MSFENPDEGNLQGSIKCATGSENKIQGFLIY